MGRWSAESGRARFHCTTTEPLGRSRVWTAPGASVTGGRWPTANQIGAASSLLNASRRRPLKYQAARPPTTMTRRARAGAIWGGRLLGRAIGDSIVGLVTWARTVRGA